MHRWGIHQGSNRYKRFWLGWSHAWRFILPRSRIYFSEWDVVQSSTYREILGVTRCLQSLIEIFKGKMVVVQVDAMNILGIFNRGSPRLALNVLARELFGFCLLHKIVLSTEWVPKESNAFADDISKWLIPDDFSISRHYFSMLDNKWGPHTCDTFSSNENNQCPKFYSLHWCRGNSGANSFVFDWSEDNCWIQAPFRLIGKFGGNLVTKGRKPLSLFLFGLHLHGCT